MKTVLDLLARDGTCYMAFAPRLSHAHYGELMVIARENETVEEMRAAITAWATLRGLRFSLDESKEPNGA